MSVSSVNTAGFSSQTISNKPDPAHVKKAAQQNHDVKDAATTNASTKSATSATSAAPVQQASPAALLTPSVNTTGQTVGQFVSVKA
ncbi:hypothetical protein [Undibacterium sp. RuRC25W]|uniref:hypothetical protein n=1 Tax=Undibacterium sp. RuRC25W TaxID=3413047 RepID=UPI003BF30666